MGLTDTHSSPAHSAVLPSQPDTHSGTRVAVRHSDRADKADEHNGLYQRGTEGRGCRVGKGSGTR